VFDGARRFEGVTPDLERHFVRINRSAEIFGLDPCVPVERWLELAEAGFRRFAPDAALYIRPMYWPELGMSGGGVAFDAASTSFCLSLYEAPLPEPAGSEITVSPFTKPSAPSAPVEAKASCLYPNNARALLEARRRGFGNCLMLDAEGSVAELANANVFLVRDGVALTPAPTGVFLNGVTRQRVAALLRADGVQVTETRLTVEDFRAADEIFSCGNFLKVAPVIRFDDRVLGKGPIYARARALYWAFAHERS
jgi:branched-chain amino acid aminotransferase